MTAFTNIPKQVEDVLEKWNAATSRRNFLKSVGPARRELQRRGASLPLRLRIERASRRRRRLVRIRIPTSSNSIRGSSFMRTTPQPSTSERRTAARAPERPSGR